MTITVADPYPDYRRLREAAPVRQAGDTWWAYGWDEVNAVLTDRRFGRCPPGGGSAVPIPPQYATLHHVVANWLVFLDPPEHTAARSRVAGLFTPARVAALRPRIEELVDELLAGLADRPVADLVADFAAPLPIRVIADVLEVPAGEHRWLRERAVALQQANSSHHGDGYPAAERAARELSAFFAIEAGHLDVPTAVHLLTAGHETTTNLIAKSVLALQRHPEVRAELSAEPRLMPQAVEELVRYDGPVQLVRRRAQQDVRIGGRHVAAGSGVVLVLGSADRDPARFTDPDRLDIHRTPLRHAGFGLGAHYCLGAQLARLEAEIALTALLRRLPRLRLAEDPVPYAEDLVFHGPSRLLVHPSRSTRR
ncbi:cytochrome P450 [Actinoplanes cyaneus]|uniref:Cytochrome P450 n=1 Tax=Actinoplanes cyaneus TaxID=52696 RepID=A0A919M3D6_9ACTN|nr:cytochrome P450 [Actinoplanes cyaneus]MCW2141738.1 Cytochrome P450 [Actinoplanes cyaneus]GID68180.1 cytochrome P450 [Actinoplanes cyaneus]